MEGNLKVPDGKIVLHATDTGFWGKGIYTSPDPQLSLAYAGAGGVVFLCLALPGKMKKLTAMKTGCACARGFDSHSDPTGDRTDRCLCMPACTFTLALIGQFKF